MSQPVSLVLVGVGGYGSFYVNGLLDKVDRGAWRLAGIVDPFAQNCSRLAELLALGAPRFDSLAQFAAAGLHADLAIIASPIHLHTPQTCAALALGMHVLCEKPLGATIQEAATIIAARDRAGKQVGIGYQWSHSRAIGELKADFLAGKFGPPLRLKTIVLWPRAQSYYGRNNWAGALRNAKGDWILDSPVNNATAHHLHNMFYVLGPAADRSALPVSVQAELYRANDIQNYDTCATRIRTDNGAELLYYCAHPVKDNRNPEFYYEFEHAVVTYRQGVAGVVARFRNGTVKEYGDPESDPLNKILTALAVARGEANMPCPPEAAMAQTLCVNGIQESMPQPLAFPAALKHSDTVKEGDNLIWVEGLSQTLLDCYADNRLPSEAGRPWAHSGREFPLAGYRSFPSPGYPVA